MNATHLHLILNHFPIVGTLIGSLLLLWGIIKKQDAPKSIAAALLLIVACVALPVFLTGEPAEKFIRKMPGVSKPLIHEHEKAATYAIWFMSVTGVAALMALLLKHRNHPKARALFLATFILSAFCFSIMARTGFLGGQIRHPEIRTDTTTSVMNEPARD